MKYKIETVSDMPTKKHGHSPLINAVLKVHKNASTTIASTEKIKVQGQQAIMQHIYI